MSDTQPASTSYLAGLLGRIRAAFRAKRSPLTRAELAAIGVEAKAAQATPNAAGDVAAADSLQARIDAVDTALRQAVAPAHAHSVETTETNVVYVVWPPDAYGVIDAPADLGGPRFYQQDYTIADGVVTFAPGRVEVREERSYVPVSAGANADGGDRGSVAAHDYDAADPSVIETGALLRLASTAGAGGTLPAWQQIHKLGEWAVPHASGQRIRLTREMGNAIIANFASGVVRRGIPLDEMHLTDAGGPALGWVAAVRWGSEGDGLPDAPEPDGTGPILYARIRYTPTGEQRLADEEYRGISPQYHTNYTDKESGRSYGCTLLAVAATNNPFLRLRSLQGEAAPEPVVLSDGLTRATVPTATNANAEGGEPMTMATETTPTTSAPAAAPAAVSLSDFEAVRARLDAVSAELNAERASRHQAEVTTVLHDAVLRGVPPAFLNRLRPILLACDPQAPQTVALSDAPDAPRDTLYRALLAAVAEAPALRLGPVALTDQTRPGNPAAMEAQIKDAAAQMVRAAGIQPIAAPPMA